MRAATINGTASGLRSFDVADLSVFGAVFFAASGHLMIKAGLNGAIVPVGANVIARLAVYLLQPTVAIGLVTYVLGTAMWVVAVSRRDISYVFPMTALNYVIVTLGGKLLFGEMIPPKRWLGIAIVMTGVALMQITGKKSS